MAENVRTVPYGDHPERCQGTARTQHGEVGQCWNFRVEGSEFCMIHGGSNAIVNTPIASLNLYRVRKYEKRIADMKSANASRTIDEEMAILRMTLEEVLEKASMEGEMGLLLYSTKIQELIRDIKTCVLAADKLATKAGQLMGRSEAIVVAGRVVEILTSEISDEAMLERIAEKIADAFAQKVDTLDEVDS